MVRVLGLGHIGIYVRDLDRMAAFYRDVLGMQVTKRDLRRGFVFLSADPKGADHEIALMQGRPQDDNPHLVNQISLRLGSLADLREFHRRLKDEGFQILRVTNHGSAIGCYFADPEGNTTEVFWVTGLEVWVPTAEPVDLALSDEEIMAAARKVYERNRDVPMGMVREEMVAATA